MSLMFSLPAEIMKEKALQVCLPGGETGEGNVVNCCCSVAPFQGDMF